MSLPLLDLPPFTIHNLPYGIISTPTSPPRCATAIGNHAIDLAKYTSAGRLSTISKKFGHVDFLHVFGQVTSAYIYWITCKEANGMS